MSRKKVFIWLMVAVAVPCAISQGDLFGWFGEDLYKKTKKTVEKVVEKTTDWGKGVWKDGKKYIGEAGKAGHYVGELSKDGLKIVSDSGKWVLTEAGKHALKLFKVVGCVAAQGIKVAASVVEKLAGKAVSFNAVTIEGSLGDATFSVKAKGEIAGKNFNITSSIGKDGFTQNGFRQIFYDPLAKLF